MNKILLDANISPETGTYLTKTFGFDVVALVSTKYYGASDKEVVALAKNRRLYCFKNQKPNCCVSQ